ncbi:MAG TPA: cytochrome P450 [Ramlibacter sp.]|jgi:cytochrome P450
MSTAPFTVPPPHWLFGSGAHIRRAPHLFFAAVAREQGGLGRFRILHRRFVSVTDADLANHVLVSGRKRYGKSFHHRNLGIIVGTGLIGSEGALWRKNRRQIQPSFQPHAMRQVVPAVVEAVGRLFDAEWDPAIRAGTPFSAGREMQRLTLLAMGRMLFSSDIPGHETARLGATLRSSLTSLRQRNLSLVQPPLWLPTPNNRRLLDCKRSLDAFVEGYVGERLARPRPELPDLLNALIAARDPETGEALSRDELVDQTKSLLLAGYETTGVALAWALYLLARHAEAAERLREEVDRVLQGRTPTWDDLPGLAYTGQVINETLRLYPPLYTTARECVEDDEVRGQAIAKGCVVVISIYGMHRNPAWGADPESFRPERFAAPDWPRRSFLPFSSGRHVCLGNNFALVEMTIAVAMIAQRYRLACIEREPVEAMGIVGLVPSRDILLEVTPR